MPSVFASNSLYRILVAAAFVVAVAGCAATPPVVKPPVYSSDACKKALLAGSEAVADFQRERLLASAEKRPANYAGPRERLARSLAILRPGKESPGTPQFEGMALHFETALAAMDRIIAAEKMQDEQGGAMGWAMFDQSVNGLLLTIAPRESARSAP